MNLITERNGKFYLSEQGLTIITGMVVWGKTREDVRVWLNDNDATFKAFQNEGNALLLHELDGYTLRWYEIAMGFVEGYVAANYQRILAEIEGKPW